MKKLLYTLTTVLAIAAFTSCDDGEGDVIAFGNTDLAVVEANLLFGPDGGTNNIVVETSGSVTATSDASWATPTVSGKTITVNAGSNSGVESRYAKITINSGSESVSVTVQQQPILISLVGESNITVSKPGGTFQIEYKSNATINITSDDDWITATLVEDEKGSTFIEFEVEANATGAVRTGTITYSAGDISGRITINQEKRNPPQTVNVTLRNGTNQTYGDLTFAFTGNYSWYSTTYGYEFHSGATITITAASGYVIQGISFTATYTVSTYTGFSVNAGSISRNGTNHTWTPPTREVNTVTFTNSSTGDGEIDIAAFSVTYQEAD